RVAFRLVLTGGAIFLAARSAGAGRAAFDAAAAVGVSVGVGGALYGLARVPEGRGLLGSSPGARRLDAPMAAVLIGGMSATVPAATFLLPGRQGIVDPLTIDYAMVAGGGGQLLLLTLATLRFRMLRRLELGVADRGAAALAIALTFLLSGAPAAWLGFAAPDRVLPAAALLAALGVSGALVIPDATVVSRSLRTLLLVCVLGSPVALFTAGVAASAPKHAGGTVLISSVLLLLVGVLAQHVSARFVPDTARWLDALGRAQETAALPDPPIALSSTLAALRDRLGPSAPSPALYRIETSDVLTVDRAGYMHESIGTLPAGLLDFCDAEPHQTLRLEVARALQVRRPDLRPALAWMEAHGYACATALRDEEGAVGVLAMPRSGRRTLLTLQEVQALGGLTARLCAVFSLSSAMAGARRRQLDAESEVRGLNDALAQARNALARQGERFGLLARRAVRRSPLGRYSPASMLLEQDLERAAQAGGPLVLLTPAGVPAEAYAATAHLQSARRDGPMVLVDGSDPREHPLTRWVDQVTSPLLLAHGGTLVILDLPALPPEVQRFLARLLVDPAAHDWRAPWLDAPTSLSFSLIASVRETVDTLVVRGRLVEELANALGDRALPLPTLAARPEDLRAIALDHLTRLGTALRGGPVGISDDALGLLVEHDWPLNDLELELLLYRALLSTRGTALRAEEVAPLLPGGPPLTSSRRSRRT
ncbi:MAG: hypothetical protein MUF64_25875, partial [Polyangiaceae bacterium]|nr:hypothetical protein [Polyangiaceae bacterium]